MAELNKISVIIPTIQNKIMVLERLVNSLIDDECVSEIIIINNKPEEPLDATGVDKLRVITPEKNIYVNPSWNLGVKEAKCENYVLLNDDVVICKDFCGMIVNSPVFNHPKTGVIGYGPESITRYDRNRADDLEPPEYAGGGKFEPIFKCMKTDDWGIAIFGKKSNYYEIPDDLKIYFGDNYLIYKNMVDKKMNYKIVDIPIKHIHSSSSLDPEFMEIRNKDFENAKKYFFLQEDIDKIRKVD